MFKKILGLTTVVLALSSFAVSAKAARGSSSGIVFTANVHMYDMTDEVTPGSKNEAKLSIYDLKLGQLSGSGLYLGGIYSMRNVTAGNTSISGSATGVSLGYVGSQGFFLKGHYLITADFDTYEEGTGFQADLGYMNNVTGALLVGVELTYRSITYKKDKDNPALDKYNKTELVPMLTIGFVF